ncbi:hypothetical protein [Desulfosporosinus shakirovi]|uniref:hypothetical protein n=1 Tax=Desulfosporosinus shakirovi TaxID=2885154 RepID=UPI001E544BD0|nr:hypothetical protein [Desulfosporosinus sp. SRJS8]
MSRKVRAEIGKLRCSSQGYFGRFTVVCPSIPQDNHGPFSVKPSRLPVEALDCEQTDTALCRDRSYPETR